MPVEAVRVVEAVGAVGMSCVRGWGQWGFGERWR